MTDNTQIITQNTHDYGGIMIIIIIIILILAIIIRLCNNFEVRYVCVFIICIGISILLCYLMSDGTMQCNVTDTKVEIPRLIETGETSSNGNQKILVDTISNIEYISVYDTYADSCELATLFDTDGKPLKLSDQMMQNLKQKYIDDYKTKIYK